MHNQFNQHQKFPKYHRLLNRSEYDEVFKKSTKSYEKNILVLARKKSSDLPRLGLVIPKKSAKLAVKRNQIKRIIRESFRCQKNSLKGLDIVVISHRGIGGLTKTELRHNLEKLWKRLQKQFNKH